MNIGRWQDARQQFADLATAYPNMPYIHYQYGVCLAQAGDNDGALMQFQNELALNSDNADAQSQVVFIYLKQGRREPALQAAEAAVKMAPDHFLPHNVLGWALLADQQFSRAIDEMSSAVRLAPDLPVTRYSLAQAYKAAGKSADAAREMAAFENLKKQQSSASAAPTNW
jgi:tetratricopeptide (TPR) repeat protein